MVSYHVAGATVVGLHTVTLGRAKPPEVRQLGSQRARLTLQKRVTVPEALEILVVVMTTAGGIGDDPRIKASRGDEGRTKVHIGLAMVVGMSATFGDGKPESRMPRQAAGQVSGGGFDGATAGGRGRRRRRPRTCAAPSARCRRRDRRTLTVAGTSDETGKPCPGRDAKGQGTVSPGSPTPARRPCLRTSSAGRPECRSLSRAVGSPSCRSCRPTCRTFRRVL